MFPATKVRAPCPNSRSAKNPHATTTRLGAEAIRKHPPHRPATTASPVARSPYRSASRPTAGSGRAARKLAYPYAADSAKSETPRSSRMNGLKTLTPYVCPAPVPACSNAATGSMTHP